MEPEGHTTQNKIQEFYKGKYTCTAVADSKINNMTRDMEQTRGRGDPSDQLLPLPALPPQTADCSNNKEQQSHRRQQSRIIIQLHAYISI